MSLISTSSEMFCEDRQGRTFSDVLNDPAQPMAAVFDFFNCPHRQRRMEESEIHHDRPALAGVVRELEALPAVDAFLANQAPGRTKRLRQAVGVLVRIIMEARGWKKTGRKGSLGVRAPVSTDDDTPGQHNTGGLAFWFLRAERYEREGGMPFQSVRERSRTNEKVSRKTRHPVKTGNGKDTPQSNR